MWAVAANFSVDSQPKSVGLSEGWRHHKQCRGYCYYYYYYSILGQKSFISRRENKIAATLGHVTLDRWLNYSARAGGSLYICARPEGPKLEPKGPRAEAGFPRAQTRGFRAFRALCLDFMAFK